MDFHALLEVFPNSRMELVSLNSPTLANGLFTASTTWKAQFNMTSLIKRRNLDRKMHKQRIPGEHEVGHRNLGERPGIDTSFSHSSQEEPTQPIF